MAASAGVKHRFLRYRVSSGTQSLVGLVDEEQTTVTAIINQSTGSPYSELYDVLEDHPDLPPDFKFELLAESEQNLSEVEKLAPLTGRDIICIGKNYAEHAKEFNQSGFDASDKKDQPEFPVFFTKRASSIVPDGHPIHLHPAVTSSVDYEGELGIIIGRGGARIKKEDAWKHVWGAVIINDVTARERQRDHKQFFIGKSLDTFCPMGAYVIPSSSLSFPDLHLTTEVNGEIRQSQNTSELIFDVPTLIETASMGISLMPGDIIATGTPYGTGMATNTWLKEGDLIEITIPPLGTLRSTVASPHTVRPVDPVRSSGITGVAIGKDIYHFTVGSPPKTLHVEVLGPKDGRPILFFHGLSACLQTFKPAIEASGLLQKNKFILFDLDGHGQSSLSLNAYRGLSISQFAQDGRDVLRALNVSSAHIVGHSMGGLTAAVFATRYPDMVENLVLIAPSLGFGAERKQGMRLRAEIARSSGMSAVAERFAKLSLSAHTHSTNPLAKTFVEQIIRSTPQQGYILACNALAQETGPDYSRITAKRTVIVVGTEDSTVDVNLAQSAIQNIQVVWMKEVGHWPPLEDVKAMGLIFADYLA